MNHSQWACIALLNILPLQLSTVAEDIDTLREQYQLVTWGVKLRSVVRADAGREGEGHALPDCGWGGDGHAHQRICGWRERERHGDTHGRDCMQTT